MKHKGKEKRKDSSLNYEVVKIPKNYIECVRKIIKKDKEKKYNPYAVCRISTGYYGTTKDIGLLHPKKKR